MERNIDWEKWAPTLHKVGWAALFVGFAIIMVAAGLAIHGLGVLFHIDEAMSWATSIAMVIGFIGHAFVAAFAHRHGEQFHNVAPALVWLALMVFLSGLYSILRLFGITAATPPAQIASLLAQGGAVISPELINTGRIVYAILPAAVIISLAWGIFVSIGISRRIVDSIHTSLGHVASNFMLNAAAVIVVVYSALHMYTFGQLIGANMVTCIASMGMAEFAFVGSMKRALANRHDWKRFISYLALGLLAIAYAFLANWLEGRALGAAVGIADPVAQTVAVTRYINTNSLARFVADLYATSGIIFGAALAVLEILTGHLTHTQIHVTEDMLNVPPFEPMQEPQFAPMPERKELTADSREPEAEEIPISAGRLTDAEMETSDDEPISRL